ncbi:MAG: DUF4412 domain-containing protein [Myxococcota bacterium]
MTVDRVYQRSRIAFDFHATLGRVFAFFLVAIAFLLPQELQAARYFEGTLDVVTTLDGGPESRWRVYHSRKGGIRAERLSETGFDQGFILSADGKETLYLYPETKTFDRIDFSEDNAESPTSAAKVEREPGEQIAGRKTELVKIDDPSTGDRLEVWVSTDLRVRSPFGPDDEAMLLFPTATVGFGVRGVPLKLKIKFASGGEQTWEVESIKKQRLKPKLFRAPRGYTEKTTEAATELPSDLNDVFSD